MRFGFFILLFPVFSAQATELYFSRIDLNVSNEQLPINPTNSPTFYNVGLTDLITYNWNVKEYELQYDFQKITDKIQYSNFPSWLDLGVKLRKSSFKAEKFVVPIKNLTEQEKLKILSLNFLAKNKMHSEKLERCVEKLFTVLLQEIPTENYSKVIVAFDRK